MTTEQDIAARVARLESRLNQLMNAVEALARIVANGNTEKARYMADEILRFRTDPS